MPIAAISNLLSVLGSTAALGKKAGSDQERNKATYPALFGIEETKKTQVRLYHQALEALTTFDEKAEPLREIARLIIERDR